MGKDNSDSFRGCELQKGAMLSQNGDAMEVIINDDIISDGVKNTDGETENNVTISNGTDSKPGLSAEQENTLEMNTHLVNKDTIEIMSDRNVTDCETNSVLENRGDDNLCETSDDIISNVMIDVIAAVESGMLGPQVTRKEQTALVTENESVYRIRIPSSCSWSSDTESSSSNESDYTSDSSSSSSSTESEEIENKTSREKPLNFPPKPKTNVPKTKGELTLEDLPPIEDLNITLTEEEPLEEIGIVYNIVDQLVLIQAKKGTRPLDIDSVLFLAERKPLGQIFDVLGPVAQPFYAVRFNSACDITNREVVRGLTVFSAPGRSEVTTYIFTDQLRKQKGSDASWKDNNEPPAQCLDYSDDEEERRNRQKMRAKSRGQPDPDVEIIGETKAPNHHRGNGHWNRQRGRTPSNLVRPCRFQASPQHSVPFPRYQAPPVFGSPPMFSHPPPNFGLPRGFNDYSNNWPTAPQNCGLSFPNYAPATANFGQQPNQTYRPFPPPPPPNFHIPPPPQQFATFSCPQNGFGRLPWCQTFPRNFFSVPPPPPPPH